MTIKNRRKLKNELSGVSFKKFLIVGKVWATNPRVIWFHGFITKEYFSYSKIAENKNEKSNRCNEYDTWPGSKGM